MIDFNIYYFWRIKWQESNPFSLASRAAACLGPGSCHSYTLLAQVYVPLYRNLPFQQFQMCVFRQLWLSSFCSFRSPESGYGTVLGWSGSSSRPPSRNGNLKGQYLTRIHMAHRSNHCSVVTNMSFPISVKGTIAISSATKLSSKVPNYSFRHIFTLFSWLNIEAIASCVCYIPLFTVLSLFLVLNFSQRIMGGGRIWTIMPF